MKTTVSKIKAIRGIKANRIIESKKRIKALKAAGYSNVVIAKTLGLSENVVRFCGEEN